MTWRTITYPKPVRASIITISVHSRVAGNMHAPEWPSNPHGDTTVQRFRTGQHASAMQQILRSS